MLVNTEKFYDNGVQPIPARISEPLGWIRAFGSGQLFCLTDAWKSYSHWWWRLNQFSALLRKADRKTSNGKFV
jgi:hypothetical protein